MKARVFVTLDVDGERVGHAGLREEVDDLIRLRPLRRTEVTDLVP